MHLVYFIGNQGSGKTTQSENLVQNHGYQRVSFAEPIRRVMAHMLAKYSDSMDVEQIYQAYFVEPNYTRYKTAWIELTHISIHGTRFGLEGIGEGSRHEIDERIWVRAAHEVISKIWHSHPDANLVTDDVRRPWEEAAMRDLNAFGVMLNKPGSDDPGNATEECQMYFERGDFNPHIAIDFDRGLEETTDLVVKHVIEYNCGFQPDDLPGKTTQIHYQSKMLQKASDAESTSTPG